MTTDCTHCKAPTRLIGVYIPTARASIQEERMCDTFGCRERLQPFRLPPVDAEDLLRRVFSARGIEVDVRIDRPAPRHTRNQDGNHVVEIHTPDDPLGIWSTADKDIWGPGHQHQLMPDGGGALVCGCGCVLAYDGKGKIIERLEACRIHGGDREPGSCRTCDADPPPTPPAPPSTPTPCDPPGSCCASIEECRNADPGLDHGCCLHGPEPSGVPTDCLWPLSARDDAPAAPAPAAHVDWPEGNPWNPTPASTPAPRREAEPVSEPEDHTVGAWPT